MGFLTNVGKELAKKSSRESSSEGAKRGSSVMGRRPARDMGMVEEVEVKRLSGSASSAAEESTKRGNGRVAVAGAAVGAAGTAAALSSREKEDTKESSSRSESKGSSAQEDRSTRDSGRSSSSDKEESGKGSSKASSFGAAFKEARAAGKDVFTYEGKKYTTELASEKKTSSEKPTGVREGRNENIDDDTRKRAMESVANLNKGGMVFNKGIGASMKPHNVFGSKKR